MTEYGHAIRVWEKQGNPAHEKQQYAGDRRVKLGPRNMAMVLVTGMDGPVKGAKGAWCPAIICTVPGDPVRTDGDSKRWRPKGGATTGYTVEFQDELQDDSGINRLLEAKYYKHEFVIGFQVCNSQPHQAHGVY